MLSIRQINDNTTIKIRNVKDKCDFDINGVYYKGLTSTDLLNIASALRAHVIKTDTEEFMNDNLRKI